MISDDKLMSWCQMISSDCHTIDIPLGLESGSRWETKPPYPDLFAIDVKETQVRRVVLHEVVVAAEMAETEESGVIKITRLVAELEGGNQIELSRVAEPASSDEAAAPTDVCNACNGKIVDESETVMIDSLSYHRRCVD